MSSPTTDRRLGLTGGTAIKAPVACATTANITLSGEQTIDGVLTAATDVLVKNQTSGVDNGIYTSDTGTWTRRADFDGANDAVQGTLVLVNSGSTNAGFWYVSTTGTITPGSTSIAFLSASVGLALVSAFMQPILAAADATTAYKLLAAAGISLTGDITPPAFSASQDDWAPTGFSTASTIRASSSLAVNLTGIAGGSDGRTLILHNVGTFAITLKDNTTSSGANQFQLSGDYVLNPDASVSLDYDSTSSKWRLLGQQGTQASVSFNRLVNNVGLSVTMGSSAATIALKDATGADPSAASPCTINVRNGTLATGTVNQRTVQAALSTVISSGSTAGTASTIGSRIYVAAIDAGGAIELAWNNCTATPDENTLISTTAEGGAGAADSAGVWYSTTARSNVAFTILGYFESTQATAGTWATAPSKIAINPPSLPVKNFCTVSLTGCTAGVTGTAYYSILDNAVMLDLPALSGTSNTTAATITGLPAAIQPISTKSFVCNTTDNSTATVSVAQLAGGSGTITLFHGTTGSPTFTNSGTKGLNIGGSISYTLN